MPGPDLSKARDKAQMLGLGLEAALTKSKQIGGQMEEYARQQGQKIPYPGPKPGTTIPIGETLAAGVGLANPVPQSKAELAVVPFGAVMDDVMRMAPRMYQHIPIEKLPEYIEKTISPRLMRMVVKANKEGVDHLDLHGQASWMNDNITRGVRDLTGKMHWQKPGTDELHADIIERLARRGIEVSEDAKDLFFKWGEDIVDYGTGTDLERAFGSYVNLVLERMRRGR